jgi:hypothetical protein
MLGAASLRTPSHFPPIAGSKFWKPLIFAPGLAKLATKPLSTGSETWVNTIGIVLVTDAISLNVVLMEGRRACAGASPDGGGGRQRERRDHKAEVDPRPISLGGPGKHE